MSTRQSRTLAYTLVTLWAITTLAAFWWFEFKDLRAFDGTDLQNHAQFAAAPMRGALETQMKGEFATLFSSHKPVVIHLLRPDCQCNRFTNLHLREVVSRYQQRGVGFAALVASDRRSAQVDQFKQRTGITLVQQTDNLQQGLAQIAAPAALVFDGNGHLQYIGPYGSGAFCRTDSGQYVENSLDTLLEGGVTPSQGGSAFGCFCHFSPATV